MSGQPEHDPLQPHAHDPNPDPPTSDPAFVLTQPHGAQSRVNVENLRQLPLTTVDNCYIVSTGHGTSGPFTFGGVQLLHLVQHYVQQPWSQVEVISADGFGNRVQKEELLHPDPAGSIILAYAIDGERMTRRQGLVRMVVPSERDDALRQVKWVGKVNVRE